VTPPLAVLFDLDGTLIDSIELIVRSFEHATGAHLRAPLGRDVILPTIGLSLVDTLERMAPGQGADLLRTYRAFMHAHHDTLIAEYAGVAPLLAALRARGLPLGIVTSKALSSAAPSFARFGLPEQMAVIVAYDDTTRHKPHPDPLLLAAARLGLPPAACWYVGDSPHDMEAARKAGMTAVAAGWGPFPRAELAPLADAFLNAPADLLDMIEQTNHEKERP